MPDQLQPLDGIAPTADVDQFSGIAGWQLEQLSLNVVAVCTAATLTCPMVAAPYRSSWEQPGAQRFFDRQEPPEKVSLSVTDQREDATLLWREVTFAVGSGGRATATVITPLFDDVSRGVVLAHGGHDDGRRFFLSEAAALAAGGAAVVLPVTRMRPEDGADAFAAAVRVAVLTERAALDVLTEVGAPPDSMSFLGHSAGGFLGAILAAVEPRLSCIGIFGYGAGALVRATLAADLCGQNDSMEESTAAADWFDASRFVAVGRRATLLIQHGRFDRDIPLVAGRALFDAAAEPKTWLEYESDHGLAGVQHRADRAKLVMGRTF